MNPKLPNFNDIREDGKEGEMKIKMDEEDKGEEDGIRPKAYTVLANYFLDDVKVLKMTVLGIEK